MEQIKIGRKTFDLAFFGCPAPDKAFFELYCPIAEAAVALSKASKFEVINGDIKQTYEGYTTIESMCQGLATDTTRVILGKGAAS